MSKNLTIITVLTIICATDITILKISLDINYCDTYYRDYDDIVTDVQEVSVIFNDMFVKWHCLLNKLKDM